ncbi:MAG: hypothetical protein WA532_09495 [Candidatus Korobacteraceae bacterium]
MAKKQVLLLGFALAAMGVAQGQNAIGEVFSGDASVRGQVLFSNQGTQVLSGSQVAAGAGAAVLKLKRGGQVRICPGTNLSLTSDASGQALALAMSAGSMELNYTLTSAADAVLTPDFRLQLISPGTFHLAISVGASGDTCVRSLPGNDAAVFVAEMMGKDSYQLSPWKSVLFGGGKISGATVAPESCGCPEPARMPEVAESAPGSPAQGSSAETVVPPPEQQITQPQPAEKTPEAAAEQTAVAHLQSNTQFVFRGDQPEPDLSGPVSRLSISTDNSALALALLPQVSGPPAPPAPAEKKSGFLHWLKHVFGR